MNSEGVASSAYLNGILRDHVNVHSPKIGPLRFIEIVSFIQISSFILKKGCHISPSDNLLPLSLPKLTMIRQDLVPCTQAPQIPVIPSTNSINPIAREPKPRYLALRVG